MESVFKYKTRQRANILEYLKEKGLAVEEVTEDVE